MDFNKSNQLEKSIKAYSYFSIEKKSINNDSEFEWNIKNSTNRKNSFNWEIYSIYCNKKLDLITILNNNHILEDSIQNDFPKLNKRSDENLLFFNSDSISKQSKLEFLDPDRGEFEREFFYTNKKVIKSQELNLFEKKFGSLEPSNKYPKKSKDTINTFFTKAIDEELKKKELFQKERDFKNKRKKKETKFRVLFNPRNQIL